MYVVVALFIFVNGEQQAPVYFTDLEACQRGLPQMVDSRKISYTGWLNVSGSCVEGVATVGPRP
jgi:hypothetical protein